MSSTTVFESTSKSILTRCRSLAHSIAFNIPIASPISTSTIGENHSVRANTKALSTYLIHIPIPTLLVALQKEASILHLYILGEGLAQITFCLLIWEISAACFNSWAFSQRAKSDVALWQTTWQFLSHHSKPYYFGSSIYSTLECQIGEFWKAEVAEKYWRKQWKCLQHMMSQLQSHSIILSVANIACFLSKERERAI